jgi:hypothetical protein
MKMENICPQYFYEQLVYSQSVHTKALIKDHVLLMFMLFLQNFFMFLQDALSYHK